MKIKLEGTTLEIMQQLADHMDARLGRAEARDFMFVGVLGAIVTNLRQKNMLGPQFISALNLVEAHLKDKADDPTREDVDIIMTAMLMAMGVPRSAPKRPTFTVIDGGME